MAGGREEGKAEGIHWLGGFAMQVNFDCGLLSPAVVFGKVIGGQHSWYLLETTSCICPACFPPPPVPHHLLQSTTNSLDVRLYSCICYAHRCTR